MNRRDISENVDLTSEFWILILYKQCEEKQDINAVIWLAVFYIGISAFHFSMGIHLYITTPTSAATTSSIFAATIAFWNNNICSQ